MKIVIGSSMKYRSVVKEVQAKLESLGIVALFPNPNFDSSNKDHADSLEEKKRLAIEHYEAIDEADIAYWLTPEGYMGTSCKLELGYAIAKNKPIYFSEPTNDIGLDCYVTEFISVDNLEEFLKN